MNDHALKSLLADSLHDLQGTQVRWQALAVVLIAVIAALLSRWVLSRMRDGSATTGAPIFLPSGTHSLFPLLAGLLTLIAAHIAEDWHHPAHLARVAALLLLTLGGMRLATDILGRVFQPSATLLLVQRLLVALLWLLVALHVTGLLPDVVRALEIPVYGSTETHDLVTLLEVLKAGFGVCAALIFALWAGAAIDARLARLQGLDVSLKVALARFLRALLLVIAVLVSMEAVGIPLAVLSVFGGALGVGLGLGLQRIASNYVSGFIILLDHSLRIGDLVSVDKYYGTVAQIRTRYTVVQALDGTEAIIPNEQLVSSVVVNHSYTSTKLRVAVKLVVTFDSDIERALTILLDAARRQERVLADPAPSALLSAFVADGLEVELGFWVADPDKGTGLVRSEIGRFVLAEFRKAGIVLAAPVRDVRLTVTEAVGEPGPVDARDAGAAHAVGSSTSGDMGEPTPPTV